MGPKPTLARIAAAWAFGFVLAGAYAAGRFVPAAGWSQHDVLTGTSSGYPDLQPRRYDSTPDNTTAVAAAVAVRLPHWKVVSSDLGTHQVVCEVHDLFGLIIDDVTIGIQPDGPDGTASRVLIRSRSRRGFIGDLGANARNIRTLQAAMDDKLPPLSPSQTS